MLPLDKLHMISKNKHLFCVIYNNFYKKMQQLP